LGIIRHIIKNVNIPFGLTTDEYAALKLKGQYMKHKLVIELLQIPNFYNFIRNINYYEWDSHKELSAVSFSDYLVLFMAKNFKEFDRTPSVEHR